MGNGTSGMTKGGPIGRETLAMFGPVVYAARVSGGRIKIGFTANPRNRVQSLGIGVDALLALKFNATPDDEATIHSRLRGHAVSGREWYPDDDAEVLAVVNEMRADIGLTPL